MTKFTNPIRALKYRNYRLYWFGMTFSQAGTWMQNIAQPWFALEITNNATLVGMVSAVQFLPLLIFSLFSGALLDRVDKKFILKLTQIGFCLTSFVFGLVVLFDFASYLVVLSLAFLTGIFNSLDAPCRQSIVYELVEDKSDISNAVALNSMSINSAKIIGPSLAGVIMLKLGLAACFFINSASFLVILLTLFFIKITPLKLEIEKETLLNSVICGFNYIKGKEILLSPLIVLLIIGIFLPNYNVTISAMSKFILDGSSHTFAYLMVFLGVGSFFGALWIAFTGQNISYKTVKFMPFIAASFSILIGYGSGFYSIGIFLAFCGFSTMICTSTINSLLQLNSKEIFRGRVMSLYTLFFQGSTPIGAIIAGLLVSHFGASATLVISGICVYILLGCWWILKTRNLIKI